MYFQLIGRFGAFQVEVVVFECFPGYRHDDPFVVDGWRINVEVQESQGFLLFCAVGDAVPVYRFEAVQVVVRGVEPGVADHFEDHVLVFAVYREKMVGETHQDVLSEDLGFALDVDFGLIPGDGGLVFVGMFDHLSHDRITLLGRYRFGRPAQQ